ncbi:MAG: hypothetical protein ACRDCC_01795 [Culicoidibacterales bacterium]
MTKITTLQQLRSENRKSPLAINQLVATFDYQKLAENYQFFQIKTTEKFFRMGSQLLDSPLLTNNVLAIQYERGNCLYIMMRYHELNHRQLGELLKTSEERETTTYGVIEPQQLKQHHLLQILFNSLWASKYEEFQCSNLTGRLIAYHSSWIKAEKYAKHEKCIKQIHTLEFKIREGNQLDIVGRTFSNVRFKKMMKFSKKARYEDFPKFTYTVQNLLQRQRKETANEETFILRQIGNKRKSHEFLNIKNLQKFETTKLGMLAKVLEQFEYQFGNCVQLQFQTIPEHTQIQGINRTNPSGLRSLQGNTRKLQKPLTIIDMIKTEQSQEVCNELVTILNQSGFVKAKMGKRLSKGNYNLKVIHEKEYYTLAEEVDPYEKRPGYIVQHVSIEALKLEKQPKKDLPALLQTLLNELYIKEDLQVQKIELYDWQKLEYSQAWTFVLPHEVVTEEANQKQTQYYAMVVQPDGSFEIKQHQEDLFNTSLTQSLVNICEQAVRTSEKVIGVVCNERGEINLIRETHLYPIPEILAIKKQLRAGQTQLRNKEQRDQLLNAMLDITWFQYQAGYYYFVGSVGNGVQATFSVANRIRKVESYQNDPIFFDKLLDLMNVHFVRNNRLTVIPFPFKYLREYIAMEEAE